MAQGMIVDAHLDIAWNALNDQRGFDTPSPKGYLVNREGLVAAGVGLVFPTIFSESPMRIPSVEPGILVYRTPREAELLALAQLAYYRSLGLPLLTTRAELHTHVRGWRPGKLAGVLLMENADPIVSPARVGDWARRGLRIVGPAWSRSRYSGGTGAPGGLTEHGRKLLAQMRRHGLVLDLSHMADRSMRDALEAWSGPLVATHGGARSLNPGQRQFPDWALTEIGKRDGVVGVSFYAGHLRPVLRAGVDDVVRHLRHFARVTGDPSHVGIGTDLDGGFSSDQAAVKDLSGLGRLRQRLARHFSAADVDGIMGGNWIRFLERSLP